MHEENMVYTYDAILFSYKKENLAIWENMDGPWGFCAKWNKSDRKRQIPHNFHLYVEYKQTELIETENKHCLPHMRVADGGNGWRWKKQEKKRKKIS